MYKIVLIDDGKMIQRSLRGIIESFIEEVEIVGLANNVAQGIEQINLHQPDIVILDIEMPDGTGIDLLKQLDSINFALVFCTTHDGYALQAFKYNAIKYILKPFDIEEVILAIRKAKESLKIKEQSKRVGQLLSFIQDNKSKKEKIVLKTVSDIFVLAIKDIYNCQADGGYTIFMFKNERKITVSNNLKTYESILLQHNFIKTHRSHLVNVNYIERINKKDGGSVILDNSRELPLSNRKRESILEMISKI
jgi:two-component system LytT family response regulator